MIPKIIHYVWVGGAEKSELVNKCIESWQRFLPEYQIIEWNDEALLKLNNQYALEAYREKKWAFVSDYLRLYALYNFGGFYFDTDLEITQSLNEFLNLEFVTGFEKHKGGIFPVTALMGCQIHNKIVEKLLSDYSNRKFILPNGDLDLTTNTVTIAKLFNTFGLSEQDLKSNNILKIEDKAFIYPSHYFCTPERGLQNFSIHHFGGSWVTKIRRKKVLRISRFNLYLIKHESFRHGEFIIPASRFEVILFLLLFSKFGLLVTKHYK